MTTDPSQMNQPPTEALLDATTSGTVDFGEWQTWFRITGDLHPGTTPVVAAHGGPGGTHDYLLTMAERPCVNEAIDSIQLKPATPGGATLVSSF